MLFSKVEKTIKDDHLIKKGDKIIVGVSGGPDSICLLDLLYRFKDQYNLNLFIIHINHGLRKKESLAEQIFVENLAKRLGLPVFIKKIDVLTYKKKEKLSLEEAARNLRYKIFGQICQKEKIDKLALAHTASDQVETILMNFLRGGAVSGLSGMDYQTDFKIFVSGKKISFQVIRPLLDYPRSEILNYLKGNNLKFCIDKTNLALNFTRNRIRHLLIPLLREYNPSFEKNISKKAQLFRFLNNEIEAKIKKIIKQTKINKNKVEFSLKKWQGLEPFYKREVLLVLIKEFLSARNIGTVHIEEVVSLLENSSTGGFKTLPGSLIVYKSYDKLIISQPDWLFSKKTIRKKRIRTPGVTEIPEIEANIETCLVSKKLEAGHNKIFVDYDKTGQDIFIRSRREGDRFKPLKFRGSKKIQDFLVDKKIPVFLRDSIPILINKQNQIIWLCGLRADRRFRVNSQSKKILEIKFIKYK
jgi:tRNA(Ile)-lysidine synthase